MAPYRSLNFDIGAWNPSNQNIVDRCLLTLYSGYVYIVSGTYSPNWPSMPRAFTPRLMESEAQGSTVGPRQNLLHRQIFTRQKTSKIVEKEAQPISTSSSSRYHQSDYKSTPPHQPTWVDDKHMDGRLWQRPRPAKATTKNLRQDHRRTCSMRSVLHRKTLRPDRERLLDRGSWMPTSRRNTVEATTTMMRKRTTTTNPREKRSRGQVDQSRMMMPTMEATARVTSGD